MVEIFTIYYPINSAARTLYNQLMQDHRCLFVNSGSLKDSKDPWTQQHVVFETDFEDNIADKNHLMNELTAWWTAKNHLLNDVPDDEWVKCSHYRKRLEKDIPLESADILVAQTISLQTHQYGTFTIEGWFKKWHPKQGWDVMEGCLRRCLDVDDFGLYNRWKEMDVFVAPLNIYTMRKRDIMRYWEWLFPIVFEIAEKLDMSGQEYQTLYQQRAIGFISERLFSLWAYIQQQKGMKVIQTRDILYDGFKPISDEEERMTKI